VDYFKGKVFKKSWITHFLLIKVVDYPPFVCRNPSLGFATKARARNDASQEGSPRVTSHAPGSVGECERMNPHITE
jgi:hypothetical protein